MFILLSKSNDMKKPRMRGIEAFSN